MIAATEVGRRIKLTVRGIPVADIVPHGRRSPWLDGAWLESELEAGGADPALAAEFDSLAGQTLGEI